MRVDCEVIGDLLPLYVEELASEKSTELVEEHLAECESCRQMCQRMKTPEPRVEFEKEESNRFVAYIKKRKKKAIFSVVGIVLFVVFFEAFVLMACMGLLTLDGILTKVEVYTDVGNYEQYMGENAKEEFADKCGMDETIFPEDITSHMNVLEYKMVYYNPWDAQYLSYLTVGYGDEEYAKELERLGAYQSTEYVGNYGVTGFASGEPLAMYADEYQGFVYAIQTPGKKNTITYVELIFCNYFYDLKYEEYIPQEYLPEGFNAKNGNPYRKKMLEEAESD